MASDYEPIRNRRGTDRAIIALARKLPGIICHTLTSGGLPGLREFLLEGNYSVKEGTFVVTTEQTNVIEGE